MMGLRRVAMKDNASVSRKQFIHQLKPFVHELKVVIVRPYVGVLHLFSKGVRIPVELDLTLCTAKRNFPHVIRAGIEGRINVNKLHLAAESTREQVSKYFLVVTVEEQPTFGVRRRPIAPVAMNF